MFTCSSLAESWILNVVYVVWFDRVRWYYVLSKRLFWLRGLNSPGLNVKLTPIFRENCLREFHQTSSAVRAFFSNLATFQSLSLGNKYCDYVMHSLKFLSHMCLQIHSFYFLLLTHPRLWRRTAVQGWVDFGNSSARTSSSSHLFMLWSSCLICTWEQGECSLMAPRMCPTSLAESLLLLQTSFLLWGEGSNVCVRFLW